MSLGSPPQSPCGYPGYQSPPLHSLSLSSPPPPQYQHSNTLPLYQQHPQQSHQHQQNSLSNSMSGQPGGGSGYLPGFLMGDPVLQSPSTPSSLRPLVSPNKLSRSLSTQPPPAGSNPHTPVLSQQLRGPGLLKENMNSSRSGREKTGGPPTTSLLFTPSRVSTSSPGSASFNASGILSPPNHLNTTQPQEVATSPDCSPLDTWITVWGFPPSALSFVLSELSVCGTILQHVVQPNSNWIHVRLQTRMQANKALGKNGSVMGGSIMVGISPCSDTSVLDRLNTSVLDCTNTSVANLSSTLGTPRTIRPLTQAYKEAQEENRVVPGTNTPTRNNGLVSRAMEYVFGW